MPNLVVEYIKKYAYLLCMTSNTDFGQTHFGFKTVYENEKTSLVREVFDSVASKYDIMNDLMSAGCVWLLFTHYACLCKCCHIVKCCNACTNNR